MSPPPAAPPVWLMALAAFTIGCGMRLLDPLLPMLARDFGVGLAAVAPLIGGFALAYGIGQLPAGPLGDRYGKVRVAAIGMALYAATLLGAAFVPDLAALLAIRVASGLAAAAVIPLFMAHIGDTVPYGHRQAVLGRFLTGMVLANMLAAPISGTVAEAFGWRAAFLVLGGAATAITAVVLLWLGGALWRAAPARHTAGLRGFLALLERPAGRRLMGAAMADGFLLFGGAFPFVASHLITSFRLTAAEAGLVVAAFGLGALAYTRAAPALVRRFGERRLVAASGVGLALGFGAIGLAPHWGVVLAAQGWLGFAFFLLHGVLQARATEALPEARGIAVAGFALALFLGQSLGAVAFGTIIALAGFPPAFLLAAAGLAALAAWTRARVIPAGG